MKYMALRKILPKDFFNMSFEKSDEQLKEVLDKCQIGAYTRDYSKEIAFFLNFQKKCINGS